MDNNTFQKKLLIVNSILVKGFKLNTQSNIPQYHHSYSEDENLSIYKYLKSATNKNLVENIFILCQSYPEEHQKNIIEAFLQFGKEIADREYLNNCYNELLRCVNAWKNTNIL